MQPKVSVVIPTFNRAGEVSRAIDSCLNQTYSRIEIIVVDDGSTDETASAMAGYGKKIRYCTLDHSGLPARTRNAGLKIAAGEYIAFLDSDDRWLPEKTDIQTGILNNDRDCGLVCSNALVERGGQKQDAPYLKSEKERSGWLLSDLLKNNFIITSTVMIRRSILESTGGFLEDPLVRAIEDYDLWLRVAAAAKVTFIDNLLAVYQDQPASIRSEQSTTAYWQGMLYILERLGNDSKYLKTEVKEAAPLINTLTFRYRRHLLSAHLSSKEYLDAAKCVSKLIQSFPAAIPTGLKIKT